MLKDPNERVTVLSIVVTTSVGLVELFVALLFGSIALIAAGLDALTDTASSVGILAGLRISRRPADRGHPYGHFQAETFAAAVLSVLLLIAALRVAYLAVENLLVGSVPKTIFEPMVAGAVAILVLGALGKIKIVTGRKNRSMAVVADGYHTLSDAASSAAVVAGLFFVGLGYPWVDSVVALGISALILRWSFRIGREAIDTLMEASPGQDVIKKINDICMGTPGVLGCHQRRAHRLGSRIIADVHIYVDPKISVAKGHEIASKVERRLKSGIKGLVSVTVHTEPAKMEK